MKRGFPFVLAGLLAVGLAQQGGPQQRGSGVGQTLALDWPDAPVDVVLSRPTATGMTVSIRTLTDTEVKIAVQSGENEVFLVTQSFKAREPQHLPVTGLKPDTSYTLELTTDAGISLTRPFHTSRAAGQAFTFVVQADSHLDSNSDLSVYAQTLKNEAAATPDFVIDLGDTFMTDKYQPYMAAEKQYLTQRTLLGTLNTAPLFLTLGNHDGEGVRTGGKADQQTMSDWANAMRLKYFPNPVQDGFYSTPKKADGTPVTHQGSYAWTWGDAQFIVLDAYTYSGRSGENNWNATLGKAQYDWLKENLESSHSKWKFVFVHQMIGGLGKDGRGGAEAAPYFEWGGKNADESSGFAQNRPGWAMPVHDLLVKNHVSAVFHGHDHLYVKQDLNGIVYQEVPQPSNARAGNTGSAKEYHYASGTLLGGPGHLRVTVTPQEVKVEYIQTSLQSGQNAQVGDVYTIQ